MPGIRSLAKGIIGTLLVALALAIAFSPLNARAQAPAKPDIIEVIEISGEISNFTATQMKSTVEKLNDTVKVKGVLLVVNSPGGGATASANLYSELAKIKVPVVGFCDSFCASGGIYALMAPSIKYVGVRDEAMMGGVGVIARVTRYHRLLDWAKIDNETYVSGPLKDMLNPTRAAREDERKVIQGMIDDLAQRFFVVVQKARPKANMQAIKTAGLFISDEAVRVGLADKVMTYEDALAKVKALSGSKNAFTREELRKITKDASEAAGMSGAGVFAPRADGWTDRALGHADTLMEVLKEIRSGTTVNFEYRTHYRF